MRRLAAVSAALGLVTAGAIVLRDAIREDPFVVVHWSNSHPMRDGLLPDMARKFNAADHETTDGRPIEIVVVSCDSATQIDDLASRITTSLPTEEGCTVDGGPAPQPTIVTPQSADWLIDLEQMTGRDVVDREHAPAIAQTWLGIVTYREMATCLGWPEKELGYADILALHETGWAAHSCAELEWGDEPLVAFTNPSTSTSGRNVLVSLYSIAANISPSQLTVEDVHDPEVIDYVKGFQDLVGHYLPGTIPLNTKISQGPSFGQFFLMPEDNLMSLCRGTEQAIALDGTTQVLDPLSGLVMVYPREGSVLNSNPAALVDAPWVTDDHRQAAQQWIEFLLDDRQQEKFAGAGFRPTPTSDVRVDERAFAECGLSAEEPNVIIEPGELDPEVLSQIVESWGEVKNPAIVTFVVDVSGSMKDGPLEEAQAGLLRLLDEMDDADIDGRDSMVGLVAFSSTVVVEIPPGPLGEVKRKVAAAVTSLEAQGGTALFTGVHRGVELSDQAAGDPRATRAVVVLSDGAATEGMCASNVISMRERNAETSAPLCLVQLNPLSRDDDRYDIDDVQGEDLVVPREHDDIQVFFVGFGQADINIGRLLAQATDAEYQASTQANLAVVIERLSGYF